MSTLLLACGAMQPLSSIPFPDKARTYNQVNKAQDEDFTLIGYVWRGLKYPLILDH
jgi:hypothetical protein